MPNKSDNRRCSSLNYDLRQLAINAAWQQAQPSTSGLWSYAQLWLAQAGAKIFA